MESVRLRKLVDELDGKVKVTERILSKKRFEPDFNDLDGLLRGYNAHRRATQRLTGKLEALRQIRPYLAVAIEKALQEEKIQQGKFSQKALAKEIKVIAGKVKNATPGPQQSMLLLQLSKLKGSLNNGN